MAEVKLKTQTPSELHKVMKALDKVKVMYEVNNK